MAVISWGKPLIEIGDSVDGAPATVFTALPEIKQDTTKLTTTDGAIKEAKQEGGGVIDQYQEKNKYVLELELFVKKGDTKPIVDVDGVIEGEKTVRLTPEDDTLKGFIIDKSKVHASVSWSSAEGELLKYMFTGLEPATGTIVKDYTKPVAP